MSQHSPRKARRQWNADKPKLDAARRLRGIKYIDSDNEEFDNIQKRIKKIGKRAWDPRERMNEMQL